MKSKLFRDNPTPTKSFSDDLTVLAKLDISDEILEILPKSISQYILATDAKDEDKALEELRAKWKLPLQKLHAVLHAGGYFLRNMDIEDSTDDILDDLKTLVVIESEKLPKLRPFIDALRNEFQKTFADDILAFSSQRAGVKNITGITYVADLRAVTPGPSDIMAEDMDKYTPKMSCLVPVAILRLRLSDDEQVVFQMNRKTLKVLQNALKSVEKELDQAIAFVGKDKVKLGL
jgi:hypothetical protein